MIPILRGVPLCSVWSGRKEHIQLPAARPAWQPLNASQHTLPARLATRGEGRCVESGWGGAALPPKQPLPSPPVTPAWSDLLLACD